MIGYATCVEYGRMTRNRRTVPAMGFWEEHNAISVVVSSKFPDIDLLRRALAAGVAQEGPETVWVVRSAGTSGKSGPDATRIAYDALIELGVEPVVAETNRAYWGTGAGHWRDCELIANCRMCVVFHDEASPTTKFFVDKDPKINPRVRVIHRGKAKKVARKGRKPIGV